MAICLLSMNSAQHGSPENEHGGFRWVPMAGFPESDCQTTSPALPDYTSYHSYGSPAVMPIEPASMYGIGRPPPYSSQQHMQPLHPLIVPQWPSMLTSQSSYSTPTLPTATSTTPSSAVSSHSQPTPIRQTTTGGSTPRRTLTDEDRRRMCQYAEDNPGVKQTDIGLKFSVERSTVSKVLRQKEKYLFPQEGSQSPVKKSRGKFPDIERALANWARNESKRYVLTDSMIREKAKFFASTVGSNESLSKLNSTSWLERFKQKHNLVGGRLKKSPTDPRLIFSEDGITVVDSSTTSTSHVSNEMSPMSPDDISPTTSDSSRVTTRREASDAYFDFTTTERRHTHSQSVALQASGYPPSSATPQPLSSPASPAMTNASGGATPDSTHTLPPLSNNLTRPRSQTSPKISFDPRDPKAVALDENTPKDPDASVLANMLESPLVKELLLNNPFDAVNRPMRRSEEGTDQDTSMQPPRIPKSETGSPIVSPIGSPTQHEARRALELVMTFFQSQPIGVVEPGEYMTMGKLMQKLELAQSPDGPTPSLPGGLYRIDEEERQRVTKKRSIRSL